MVIRKHQRRVRANLEIDVLVVAVQHFPAGVEAVAIGLVAHRQFELVGILLQGATGEHIALAVKGKFRIPGKSVLAHRVFLAVHTEHVAVDFSHHGEQDGRATAPECGITVPEVFAAVALQGLQFGAVEGNSEIYHISVLEIPGQARNEGKGTNDKKSSPE